MAMEKKFSDSQCVDMRQMYADGYTVQQVAEFFGANLNYCRGIIVGKYRKDAGGAIAETRRTGGNKKLDDATVRLIRERLAGGEKRADVADEYGISMPTVHSYANGTIRKDAGGPIRGVDY